MFFNKSYNQQSNMELTGFEQIFTNEEGAGYINPSQNTIALIASTDYISIKKFKQLFEMLTDEIESSDNEYHTFIFDKSALRTFHQPSMKWYFLEWKTAMAKHGLNRHIKILPKLDYFKRAVEAARKPLLKQFPVELRDQISIEYFENLQEAINSLK